MHYSSLPTEWYPTFQMSSLTLTAQCWEAKPLTMTQVEIYCWSKSTALSCMTLREQWPMRVILYICSDNVHWASETSLWDTSTSHICIFALGRTSVAVQLSSDPVQTCSSHQSGFWFQPIPWCRTNDLKFVLFLQSFIPNHGFTSKHLQTHLFQSALNNP